jgi:F-type H+-transporting ATPase subunit b
VLINWFTVIAQIINFLILMVLLKIFLYDRIVKIIDEREKKIADSLNKADKKRQEAEELEKSLQDEKHQMENKRKEMLEEIEKEVKERKKQMIEDAHSEIDHLKAQWRESLYREKKNFLDNMQQMIVEQTVSLAGQILQNLADAELQEHVIDLFIKRFKDMDQDEKKQVSKIIQESGNRITLQSPFDIDAARKHKIMAVLREELADQVQVDYEIDPELFLGLNLKFRGRKIAWNLSDYLEDILEQADRLLEEQAHQRTTFPTTSSS